MSAVRLVWFTLLVLCCLMVVLWCLSWPAKAQQYDQCAERDAMLAVLADQYHEKPAEAGSAGRQGGMVELLVSNRNDGDPETWSLILTMPNGKSCLLASGKGWTTAKSNAGPPPALPPGIDPNAGTSL